VLNEEKRNRLAELIARCEATLTGAGGSAPIGPLIVVVSAQNMPGPAPGDKQKGVVAIDAEDENTDEGLVFKRPRVGVAVTSLSATDGHTPSFRDNPPSASSPRGPSRLKAVGRALLGVTKCVLPLSLPSFSNKPSNASKRKRRWRLWAETC